MAINFDEEFKRVFYAGVGAVAMTGEKAKALIDTLVEKGQITVEQGKIMNEELKHKVADKVQKGVDNVREGCVSDLIENIDSLTPEERERLKQKLADLENNADNK